MSTETVPAKLTTVAVRPVERGDASSAGRLISHGIIHLILISGAVTMMFPFLWSVLTSFKEQTESTRFPPTFFPLSWHPENYIAAWQLVPWTRYFVNTIFVAGMTTFLVLLTSSLAAYAFARMEFRGKNVLFVLFLATMMIPAEVTLIPNFVIIKNLGWYNTYFALIVPWATSVFGIFLLRQFFLGLPGELYDAARIDGCSELRFFVQIALPLARPALITIALLTTLGTWNSLLWPLVVTGSEDMRLLQVGLTAFQSETGSFYNLQMAAAMFTTLPVIVLYFFLQRYFIETVAASGVKG